VSDLERIPSDWQKLPLKRVADVTNSGCYGDDDESDERSEPLKAITTAHIDPLAGFKTENASVRYFSQREKAKYLGRPGDIFVVKSSGSNENVITGKRAQIQDENDLVFTNFLLRVRANERSNPRFLHHLLGSSLVHSRIKREVATTTYPNLNLRQYLGEPLPLPDLATQRQIADFLDRETARIDLLIEKKQRLVALLGEKRSAIITESVTGGGQVNDDWRWIKLSHAYPRIGSGTTPPDELGNYIDDGSGTNWVTTSELRESRISETKKQVSENALKRYPTLRIYDPASVLFAMYGATIGRLGVLDQPACCNQACCVFERSKVVSNKYLVYWLQHRRADLVALSVGGGQPNLSQQDLRNEKVYCPDLATQRQIVGVLDRETARIDTIKERTNASIDRLKEYRSALITAAVTGQIDVTTYAKSGTPDRRLDAIQEEMDA
jgi:type I restriction enzyme, S subunit